MENTCSAAHWPVTEACCMRASASVSIRPRTKLQEPHIGCAPFREDAPCPSGSPKIH